MKKVKAIDVARKLNLSKATVSLALNDKPGVSPQTREAVYQCVKELEQGIESQEKQVPAKKQMIKIIMVNKKLGLLVDSEMDLWSDALAVYDREIKRLGYTLGITYVDLKPDDIERVIAEANAEEVAGVVLYATEMQPDEFEPFKKIKKPMVIYDNDFSREYHCVSIDNVSAVRDAVDLVVSRGCRNIRYLGNQVDIYNFRQRRAGYRAGLRKNRLELKDNPIVLIGTVSDNVYENTKTYLESYGLPDAFIMENYQVSLGVMRALKEKNVSVPRDVSLIGIDVLPGYLMGDYQLTTIKVEHVERVRTCMMFLEQEIQGTISTKFKVYSNCELIWGNSIK